MTRSRDFESPADQLRIQLVVDIVQAQHKTNYMSTSLEIVKSFERDIKIIIEE